MNHAVDGFAFQQPVEEGTVGQVALIQARLGVHGGAVAGDKIVGNDHIAPGFDQRVDGVRADVAGSAKNKNGHTISLLFILQMAAAPRLRRSGARTAPGSCRAR